MNKNTTKPPYLNWPNTAVLLNYQHVDYFKDVTAVLSIKSFWSNFHTIITTYENLFGKILGPAGACVS